MKPRRTSWTPAEDAQLKHLFEVERKSSTEIDLPGRTLIAVKNRIQSLDLKWSGVRNAWTAEEDKQLRQLWVVEGLSAGQIEKRMPGRERNAIIGRARRQGFTRVDGGEATRAQQHVKPFKPIAERRPSRPRNMIRFGSLTIPKSIISAKAPAPERPVVNPVTLLDRRPEQCGWPINDGGPFLYCGAPKATGHKRYCSTHACAGLARGAAA